MWKKEWGAWIHKTVASRARDGLSIYPQLQGLRLFALNDISRARSKRAQ